MAETRNQTDGRWRMGDTVQTTNGPMLVTDIYWAGDVVTGYRLTMIPEGDDALGLGRRYCSDFSPQDGLRVMPSMHVHVIEGMVRWSQ